MALATPRASPWSTRTLASARTARSSWPRSGTTAPPQRSPPPIAGGPLLARRPRSLGNAPLSSRLAATARRSVVLRRFFVACFCGGPIFGAFSRQSVASTTVCPSRVRQHISTDDRHGSITSRNFATMFPSSIPACSHDVSVMYQHFSHRSL